MLGAKLDNENIVCFQNIEAAKERIKNKAHKTPVHSSSSFNNKAGTQVYFKYENFQKVGAFKFRGAYNCISRLMEEAEESGDNSIKENGVIAFSSGNHAQAVACVSQMLGIKATICMPSDAPKAKLEATKGYGADIVFYDRLKEEREECCKKVAAERGIKYIIPPYDHPYIIAGQGTAAYELLEEVPDLDVLLVPLGGGGLLSGSAIAAKGLNPNIKIFGVETQASNEWFLSFRANRPVRIEPPNTIADGMRTVEPGKVTYPIVTKLVEDILLVSDEEVVEPTGAVAPAAAMHHKLEKVIAKLAFEQDRNLKDIKLGVIISGGNLDFDLLNS